MSRARGQKRRRTLSRPGPRRGRNGHRTVSSEAEKYWQYSQECARQAVEAETPDQRDQLLDLARLWTEAALRAAMNSNIPGTRQQVGR
jgi:hypothetical protein